MNEKLEHIADIQERQTALLLNLANSYFELLGEVGGLKHTIRTQGRLLGECMERIMTLEGRGILGDFNGRIEQQEQHIEEIEKLLILTSNKVETLDANRGRYYAIAHHELPIMMKRLARRVDALESWLYTHDYEYYQQEEEKQSGNSSFELREMHQSEEEYAENTGTHPPDCRCAWCEPQEGVIEHYAG
jgi:hypothetical protein